MASPEAGKDGKYPLKEAINRVLANRNGRLPQYKDAEIIRMTGLPDIGDMELDLMTGTVQKPQLK